MDQDIKSVSVIKREVKDVKYKNVAIYIRTDNVFEASEQEAKLIKMLDNIGNINISIYRDMHGNSLLNEIMDKIANKKLDQVLMSSIAEISQNLILVIKFLKLAEENSVQIISSDKSIEEIKTLKLYKEYKN